MSVQHKNQNHNQNHILVKEGLAAVERRFLETRKVRLRDGKVFFLFIRILFFSKNATYFVTDPVLEAVTRSSFTTKVLLKISQKCQENNRVFSNKVFSNRVFSNKVTDWKVAIFFKGDFVADIFPVNVEKFSKKTTLDKTLEKNSWNLAKIDVSVKYFRGDFFQLFRVISKIWPAGCFLFAAARIIHL